MEKTITIQIPEGYDDAVFNKETNEIKFVKKDDKPRTWEEYCKQKQYTDCFRVFLSNNLSFVEEGNRVAAPCANEFNTEEEAKAVIALCKLIQLRDAWWGSWKPYWEDIREQKYCICVECGKIIMGAWSTYGKVLAFPTKEMGDEFFATFRDLIEEAKPLL